MPPADAEGARPYLEPRFFISYIRCVRIRPPLAPMVAQGDGAAVDIDDAHVPAEMAVDGDGWAAKASFGFDQVQVGHRHAGLGQGLFRAGIGPVPM